MNLGRNSNQNRIKIRGIFSITSLKIDSQPNQKKRSSGSQPATSHRRF